MTPSSQTAAPPAGQRDTLHPDWCHLLSCSPHPNAQPGALHASRGSMIPVASGDTEVTIQLGLDDDPDPRTGENVAATRLLLTVESKALMCEPVDAWINPSEARMLAALLTTYAELCERDRLFPYRHPAEVIGR